MKPHLKRLPRVIPETNPPVFLLEDFEIDQVAPFSPEILATTRMPFAGFIDDQGRTHFELNHWGWTPEFSWRKRLSWALHPDRFLGEFYQRITERSHLKESRCFVAGFAGVFHGPERKGIIHFLGARPRNLGGIPEGHPIRKEAFQRVAAGIDRLMAWLGADSVETSPCIIPPEKVKKVGWGIKPLTLWKKIRLYREGLPVSIRKTPRIFGKSYKDATGEESVPDNPDERQLATANG